MTPREPDRFEEKAREIRDGIISIRTIAAALRAEAADALERAAQLCSLDSTTFHTGFYFATAIRALASPATAPAAEPEQAGDEWICAECGRGFSSKEAMLNHHANWHVPSIVHRCPKCGRQWSRPTRCGDCDVNSEQDAQPSEPVAPAPGVEDVARAHRRYDAMAVHPLDPLVRVIVEPCEIGGHYRNRDGKTFHPSPCVVKGGAGEGTT